MTKISQLSDIGGSLAAGDEFVIRDVSDISTPNKKVTASGFIDYVIAQGVGSGFTQISAGVGPLARVLASSSGATGALTFSTAAATTLLERARIDSSGRLLIGTSNARNNYYNMTALSALLQVEGVSNASRIVSQIHNTTDNAGPILVLGKSRGGSAGSNTVVQSGDELGVLSFQGADGSELVEAARITSEVDGTPGANDMPGRLVFNTTADGAASPTERLRITSTGQLRLAGAGITFNGDTATANELDDYEEGTWVPTQDSFDTWTSPVFTARYTKIGRIVHLNLQQTGGTVGWSATDSMGGLPFAPAAIAVGYATDTTPASDNGAIAIYTNSRIYFQKANASETGLVFSATYYV